MVNSRCYRADVLHHRIEPTSHRFRYPLAVFAFDIDELEALEQQFSWFGFNRSRPLALHCKDYLDGSDQSLRQKLAGVLAQRNRPHDFGRVELITSARFLGHAFNPVSFWLCYDRQDCLQLVVAEVNNTFGERHIYILEDRLDCSRPFIARYRAGKDFYVSPFNNLTGDYEFRFGEPRETLDIRLRVFQNEKPVFNSWMRGSPIQFSWSKLWQLQPWSVYATLPRIHWEAALLYFKKKLPLVDRPIPNSPDTIRFSSATLAQKSAANLVHKMLARATQGRLNWELPDGQRLQFGNLETSAQTVPAEVKIKSWSLFSQLILEADVALGDGFVQQQWDSPDLTAVITFLITNQGNLDDRKLGWQRRLGKAWNWIQHKRRNNSLAGSRRNIQAHYDLGNELYRRFLDPSMSYSCAVYSPQHNTLEQAQWNKIDRLLEKAKLNPECHLLEIGCGWGSLAIRAVQRYGCRVTGITLSQEQFDWATAAIRQAGLSDRIDIQMLDYRQLQGKFDRVISCEMLEAVGHEHLPSYFSALERLTRPDGLAVLQAITFPDHQYDGYRSSPDWIQKAIFPGGLCPSLSALMEASRKNSSFVLEHCENIGPHYARTLREWRHRFLATWDDLVSSASKYDENFRRTWCYYLSYCEAAFATRKLATVQMVWTRPCNPTLIREDSYA